MSGLAELAAFFLCMAAAFAWLWTAGLTLRLVVRLCMGTRPNRREMRAVLIWATLSLLSLVPIWLIYGKFLSWAWYAD